MDISGRDYSEKTAEVIDAEIRKIIDSAYKDARKILEDNREVLERIAEALLKYETLTAEEVRCLIEGKALSKPTVDDLLDAEMNKPSDGRSAEDSAGAVSDELPSADAPPMPEPG